MKARIKDCPLAATVEHIGDWWTLELLHDAFDGLTRPEEFRASLGTPPDVLAARLDTLVRQGLMTRRPCPGQDQRPRPNDPDLGRSAPRTQEPDEYLLTGPGRALRPLLLAMAAWVNERLPPQDRSMILVDARTGREVEPVVVDRATGLRVDTAHHVFTAGPAASAPLRARYSGRRAGGASRRQDTGHEAAGPPPPPAPSSDASSDAPSEVLDTVPEETG
ncbi:winged helix-turn-helix transcriptional regulator [Streptomyces sp. NPDC127068]|uniref:winged helix-turn-helix transcriptional regulator n=1 Tax=Streptomyces sp. NPDC127068 TaxID=3347127 RepID=UPI003648F3CB